MKSAKNDKHFKLKFEKIKFKNIWKISDQDFIKSQQSKIYLIYDNYQINKKYKKWYNSHKIRIK
jgi:hypothetical protein